MRLMLIRFVLLLIAANVAYGTRGDLFADQVQQLINGLPNGQQYTLAFNNDYFAFTRVKDTQKTSVSQPKLSKQCSPDAQAEMTAGFADGFLLVGLDRLTSSPSAQEVYAQKRFRLLFPFHYFS